MRTRWLGLVLAITACGGDDGDELPPLTTATSLACPFPGPLPFRTEAHAFAQSDNADNAAALPRSKDQSSDAIGNPGGAWASTYLFDDDPVSSGAVTFHGLAARTGTNEGLFETTLGGEPISLWGYDAGAAAWTALGRTTTADDGSYDLGAATLVPAPGVPLYAMLEGDGSCREHYTYLLPAGTKVIVTDIDGTLTTDDAETLRELGDFTYLAAMKTAADRLLQAWAAKGYPIVYLTARPHLFRAETRRWLTAGGFPPGPVITAKEIGDASVYKTAWLTRMRDDFGWDIVAAYGNAATDIAAYANVAIPKAHTFIIGPLAGDDGTVAIPDDDYTAHIADYVTAQPAP